MKNDMDNSKRYWQFSIMDFDDNEEYVDKDGKMIDQYDEPLIKMFIGTGLLAANVTCHSRGKVI